MFTSNKTYELSENRLCYPNTAVMVGGISSLPWNIRDKKI